MYLEHYLVVAWLVPHETAAILAHILCTPRNYQQYIASMLAEAGIVLVYNNTETAKATSP